MLNPVQFKEISLLKFKNAYSYISPSGNSDNPTQATAEGKCAEGRKKY